MQRGKRSVPLAKTEIDGRKRQFLDVHFYILLSFFYNNCNGIMLGAKNEALTLCFIQHRNLQDASFMLGLHVSDNVRV
jgi:hypothetical protein